MFAIINKPFLWYTVGVLSTLLLCAIWKLVRRLFLSHVINNETSAEIIASASMSDFDKQANQHISDCKKTLLLHKKINPDWIEPLKTEIPILIRNIAQIYYPEANNPFLSPDISEFLNAIELASNDITDFLQSKSGRILNVSGNTAHKTYKVFKNISNNEKLKRLNQWYKKIRPAIQTLHYKSSIMWTVLLGRNVAVRTLQVKIVTIIGTRAIQLYSGKLKVKDEI